MPAEEPMPFAILRARRWHSGDLVFESIDFDSEVEEMARLRLEQKEPLAELKGVPAPAPHGLWHCARIHDQRRYRNPDQRARGPARRRPNRRRRRSVCAPVPRHGRCTARREDARACAHSGHPRGQRPRGSTTITAYRTRPRDNPTLENAAERAEQALDAAHARMLSSRNLGDGTMEVAFSFMDERFISVVDALSLHVYDSGVCLAGADELVTLESLPGVIREAINDGLLVITRH